MVLSQQAMVIPGFDFVRSPSQVTLGTSHIEIGCSKCVKHPVRGLEEPCGSRVDHVHEIVVGITVVAAADEAEHDLGGDDVGED